MLMRIMAVPRKSGRFGGVAVSVVEYVTRGARMMFEKHGKNCLIFTLNAKKIENVHIFACSKLVDRWELQLPDSKTYAHVDNTYLALYKIPAAAQVGDVEVVDNFQDGLEVDSDQPQNYGNDAGYAKEESDGNRLDPLPVPTILKPEPFTIEDEDSDPGPSLRKRTRAARRHFITPEPVIEDEDDIFLSAPPTQQNIKQERPLSDDEYEDSDPNPSPRK